MTATQPNQAGIVQQARLVPLTTTLTRALILGASPVTTQCPLAALVPRYMWPIANEPQLAHLLRALRGWGVTSAAMVCSHEEAGNLSDAMQQVAEGTGIRLEVVVETQTSGTAGAMRLLNDLSEDEHFLVVSSSVLDIGSDRDAVLGPHFSAIAGATILASSESAGQAAPSTSADDSEMAKSARMDEGAVWNQGETTGGMWVFSSKVLRHVSPEGYFSIREQLIPRLARAGLSVRTHFVNGSVRSLKGMCDYLRANHEAILGKSARAAGYREVAKDVWAAADVSISPNVTFRGPVILGAGCRLAEGVTIEGPSAIGDGCCLDRGAAVSRSVLWQRAVLREQTTVNRSVVTEDAVLPAYAKLDRAVLISRSTCNGHINLLHHIPGESGDSLFLAARRGVFSPSASPGLRYHAYRWAKRFLDLTISVVLLVLLSPLMLMAALAIRLETSGPILFRQKRCTRGGRSFTMLKLRTMVVNAHHHREDLRQANETDGPMFKMMHDPRVTNVGRVLRKTCLDEVPQLLNVLRGDMSLVGPRPLAMEEMSLAHGWRDLRLKVLPGLTGLWQVQGEGRLTFASWIACDNEYVKRQSLLLDLRILLRTTLHVARSLRLLRTS